jgi:hypothetical protein
VPNIELNYCPNINIHNLDLELKSPVTQHCFAEHC